MKYPEFKLETYLAAREFVAPYNLCASDLETHRMHEIVQMADNDTRSLWEELPLNYTETEGHPLLREEIARHYGNPIGKEQILCFAGAEEGIYTMAHTLLTQADHAIAITPCYQSLEALPATIGSVTKVPLKYEKKWELDIEAIARAIQPNTKLILINFPHNPTGILISSETQKKLVELARKHNLWIFSDEVYRLLEINPADRIPPIADVYEKGISLGVVSKCYGLAGLRIGWIVCQDTGLLKRMNEIKHYLSICNSAPSEILALIALKNSETILKCNHTLMAENLKLLDAFFEKYPKWFEWVRPQGGCIGYPLFKGNTSVNDLAEDLLNQEGVLILPAAVYDDSSNHFRISFGRKSMPEGLKRLEKYLSTRD